MTERRRPGRPARAGVFDTDDLLDLALDALAAGGYRGLSMRGLARLLGVSLASVQHRFATKDELWRAAVDRAVGPDVPSRPGADLADILRTRLVLSSTRPGLLLALLTDDAPGHEERHAYLAGLMGPAVDSARALLAEARALGLVRAVDVEVLVAVVMVSSGALATLPPAITDALGLGPEPVERMADGLADLLLHGVVVRDGKSAEPGKF